MSRIYYNQKDSRWRNHPYPASGGYEKKTIGTSGCGPTCAAMVISSLTGNIVRPDTMGDIFRQEGFRQPGGTSENAFYYIAKRWGLECNRKVKLDDAIACLNRGGMVITHCIKPSLFTTDGHFIVLSAMKDANTIIVFDPNMYLNKFSLYGRNNRAVADGNIVYITYKNMKEYGGYHNLFCYEAPNKPVKEEKHKTGETIVVSSVYNEPNDSIDKAIILPKYETGVIAYVQAGSQNPYLIQLDNGQYWCNDGDIRTVENKPAIKDTVGQIKKLKTNATIYSISNLTGNKYNYKANTSVKILQNVDSEVDKIRVVQTGRIGFIKNNLYK